MMKLNQSIISVLLLVIISIISVNSQNVDPCSVYTTCSQCANYTNCGWCAEKKLGSCYSVTFTNNTVTYKSNITCKSWCNGGTCQDICNPPCTKSIFPCSENIVGQLILIAFYAITLSMGAKILSDGSELLLELFPKWGTVIGALLLPVLGAIPDAAIIVVSGALGSKEDAQEQVAIGVGTLAGSTIMLLTVPWAASMHLGRCNMDDLGEAIDGRCTGFSVTKQGMSVDKDTPINARIMLITSLSYFIVQGIAFAYLYDPTSVGAHKWERPFALSGFIVCVVFLVGYCIYQVFVPKLAEKREKKLEDDRQKRFLQLRALHIVSKWTTKAATTVNNDSIQGSDSPISSPQMSQSVDHSHAKALSMGLRWKKKAMQKEETPLLEEANVAKQEEKREKEEEEEEEDPTKNFRSNMIKAVCLLIVGTTIVAFFSDPMVDVLTDFSHSIKVKPFFVSFIITPYCSNASELISSLIFAAKKKRENASLVYSQLYGAATMNNTLCLGIFFALVYFRDLAWSFTAETLSILVVTWIVGAIGAFKQDFRYYWSFPIIFLYPFSLFFVWFLEYIVHWA